MTAVTRDHVRYDDAFVRHPNVYISYGSHRKYSDKHWSQYDEN